VKLWDRKTRQPTYFTDPGGGIGSAALSPDGQTILVGNNDGRVRLWSRSGRLQRILTDTKPLVDTKNSSDHTVSSVAFSPNGELMAATYRNGRGYVWRRNGQVVANFELASSDDRAKRLNSITFSPDGKWLATGGHDNLIRIWNLQGQQVRTLAGHSSAVTDVTFSPDGRFLASAGDDSTVRIWTANGAPIRVLGHGDAVNSVRFSPDGLFVAAASWDGAVTLWSREGERLKTFKEHKAGVGAVRFSPDGRLLVSGGYDQQLIWRSLDSQELLDRSCRWLQDYLTRSRDDQALLGLSRACRQQLDR
jgi:WD40 repeat protein